VRTQEQFFHPIFNTMTPYFWVKDINESISENEDGTFVTPKGQFTCNTHMCVKLHLQPDNDYMFFVCI
jgi:hypothetical protein